MQKTNYWLKLQKEFFTENKHVLRLRTIAGGDTYTIILLKLMTFSLATDGHLYYEGVFDTFAEEIANMIGEDVEDTKVTLNFLLDKKLITKISDTDIFLEQVPLMVGSECDSAKRVREFRERKKLTDIDNSTLSITSSNNEALHCNKDVTECNENVTTEIEIEKELELEKEKDNASPKQKPVKHKYGEYQNVLLTDTDLEKLKSEFPDYQQRIENLSYYIASKGDKYKNHLATIRNWARKEGNKTTVATKSAQAYNNRYKQREYSKDDFAQIERELFYK